MVQTIVLPDLKHRASGKKTFSPKKSPFAIGTPSLTAIRNEALRGNVWEFAVWLAIAASSLAALVASLWL
jgi:hypothetical protein